MSHGAEARLTVDTFEDAGSWQALGSGLAKIQVSSEPAELHRALRLDFDFQGGGGFVVARKQIKLELSDTWIFRFRLRGALKPNRFEFKLIDRSGSNVWLWNIDPLDIDGDWMEFELPQSRFNFAWGPAGGGDISEVAAIEFVIAAGEGGSGSIWIDRFEWINAGPLRPVGVASSSELNEFPSLGLISEFPTPWRAKPDDAKPLLEFDFGRERELGGFVIEWEENGSRDFTLELGPADGSWFDGISNTGVRGALTHVPLPHAPLRRVRLHFANKNHERLGIRRITWKGTTFTRTPNSLVFSVAKDYPLGWFPKYWSRHQTLVTPAGLPIGTVRGLINEEGLLESDAGGYSLEPFVYTNNRLFTWADAEMTLSLADGTHPIPSSHWTCKPFELTTTAFVEHGVRHLVLLGRYVVNNPHATSLKGTLFIGVRPYQVTPPWQRFQNLGGVSAIQKIESIPHGCLINGTRAVLPLEMPDGFGCVAFAGGPLASRLAKGMLPRKKRVEDPLGLANGAFRFDFEVPPHGSFERTIAMPFGTCSEADEARDMLENRTADRWLEDAMTAWRKKITRVHFHLPESWSSAAATFHTCAAHILVNRDGAALQPGPRRYSRSWIRDGAVMSSALMRAGCLQDAIDYVHWYRPYIREDGLVPCCVDSKGPDWLIEYDSLGQWLHLLRECYDFGAGHAFAEGLWDSILLVAKHIDELRERRLGADYDMPEKQGFRGLLPESASHEGYLSHPVHAYWDDFWAVRGLRDAASLGKRLNRPAKEVALLERLAKDMAHSVAESLLRTMELRHISYVPGSVEWADFDPSATAVAVVLLDDLGVLPKIALQQTFDQYMAGFRARISGEQSWTNYSAYEVRVVAALVRLGRRDEAMELLEFLFNDRRPKEWNQWPEITWKDPESPGHFGDNPHSWIGAEYMLGFATLFAYEREADDTLVLAAGLPAEWFAGGAKVGVTGLPTRYGRLTYSMCFRADTLKVTMTSIDREPAGGCELQLPELPGLKKVVVNGNTLALGTTLRFAAV